MKTYDTWNLSELGSGINDPQFTKERQLMVKKYKAFANKWSKDKSFLSDEKQLKKALVQYESLMQLGTSEGMYLFLALSTDLNNVDLQKAEKKFEEFINNLSATIQFFVLELGGIDVKMQKQFLTSELLVDFKHFLSGIFKTVKHRLSEKEEHILNLKYGVAHGNWQKMLNQLLAQQTREVFVQEGKKVVKKSQTYAQISALIHNSKSKIRDTAAAALNEILSELAPIAEREFNSILENKKIDATLRGYERADQARILSDDITLDIVDTMTEVVTDNFKLARDYYKLKAQIFGKKSLNYHERNVPVGKLASVHTYKDSVNYVDQALSLIDDEFVDIYHDMIDGQRIDVFPAKGKRGGAFCAYHGHNDPVYVMLNHTNQVTDTTTLAHEMGHAIHATLTRAERPINYETPMFVAEIASNFCEEYVFDLILDDVSDKERLVLMMQHLGSAVSSIQRQVAGYNFEREIHDTFAKEGFLAKEHIGKIFTKHMKAYMGPGVSQDAGSENWWVYWGHFRSPFYVYSYASGLLLANALRAQVKENPENIVNVKKFFSTGTSMSPQELFDSIGIDITDPNFWQSGIDEIRELFKETKKLAKKLGRV